MHCAATPPPVPTHGCGCCCWSRKRWRNSGIRGWRWHSGCRASSSSAPAKKKPTASTRRRFSWAIAAHCTFARSADASKAKPALARRHGPGRSRKCSNACGSAAGHARSSGRWKFEPAQAPQRPPSAISGSEADRRRAILEGRFAALHNAGWNGQNPSLAVNHGGRIEVESLIQQFAATSQNSGVNAGYIEALYESYLTDPGSVGADWKAYFDGLHGHGDVPHAAVMARIVEAAKHAGRGNGAAGPALVASDAVSQKQAAVLKLVTAYRSRGHLRADLDPLGLAAAGDSADQPHKPDDADLDLAVHGLSDADLSTRFRTGLTAGPDTLPLRDLLVRLKATYGGTIGAEFMHIADRAQRKWVYQRLEQAGGQFGLTVDERLRILERLTAADGLERYLHTKYVGQKRFSLEGGDSLIPLMDELCRRAGAGGVKEMVVAMAHRGRLNVLVNTLGKPPGKLFDEFEGRYEHHDDPAHSGDVKYHMGFSADVATPGGPLHLALAFNPSHLEIVNPVVAGSVRARQQRRDDRERDAVLPVLIHGDAAFAGQGVGMELLQMSQARYFKVGGSVHVVINNQIGFTTSRTDDARSTLYCTDLAKMVGAPILHVNGDDPEAVVFCTRLAFDFRQEFNRDIVIDLVCYRRHGHNEADEPSATQPVMYQIVKAHKTPREIYAQRLIGAGVIDDAGASALVDGYRKKLETGAVTTELADKPAEVFGADWKPYLHGALKDAVDTRVPRAELDALATRINAIPDNIKLHPRVAKIYDDRRKMAGGTLPGDWGFAENLAYASLLKGDFKLRLVGQDAGRGTFFHRHAVLHDQNGGPDYLPLRELLPASVDPLDVTIVDSLLSEEAVMAFEYGYATADPTTLTIWEAQFGDFANGAQVVIDQFISSGEAKWNRLCGLTLLLPHGYEGQGPEHSSARLERFLQLCALDNMQVCVPTTPAQIFHLLRRQMLRATRKPLVVFSPKSLLRHKLAVSSLDELANGRFHDFIGDPSADATQVDRVVVCAGKVYYDLVEEQAKRDIKHVAIARAEQLFPFPRAELTAELQKFAKAKALVWCQEEPMNQGAWYQIQHHLDRCLQNGQKLYYAGRVRSAAPACGHLSTHQAEQARLVEDALVGTLGDNVVAGV
ncbi:MAG: 2-oxoglutarate dehydrogenase E1 component [Proteobacteria bacterium]|nr:2-oxoglutarate dehydrogenase E1 component [Pseudomonadota bacterium]